MKKIIFSPEMLAKLEQANNSVVGTDNYQRYHMENYIQLNKPKGASWHFVGCGIPHNVGTIKFTTFGTFLYTHQYGANERYRVTDDVYDLLELENY